MYSLLHWTTLLVIYVAGVRDIYLSTGGVCVNCYSKYIKSWVSWLHTHGLVVVQQLYLLEGLSPVRTRRARILIRVAHPRARYHIVRATATVQLALAAGAEYRADAATPPVSALVGSLANRHRTPPVAGGGGRSKPATPELQQWTPFLVKTL